MVIKIKHGFVDCLEVDFVIFEVIIIDYDRKRSKYKTRQIKMKNEKFFSGMF